MDASAQTGSHELTIPNDVSRFCFVFTAFVLGRETRCHFKVAYCLAQGSTILIALWPAPVKSFIGPIYRISQLPDWASALSVCLSPNLASAESPTESDWQRDQSLSCIDIFGAPQRSFNFLCNKYIRIEIKMSMNILSKCVSYIKL